MNRYSIAEFVERSAQRDRGQGLFELESERLLEVNVDGMFWMKMGAMVAYRGDVRFTREKILEQKKRKRRSSSTRRSWSRLHLPPP